MTLSNSDIETAATDRPGLLRSALLAVARSDWAGFPILDRTGWAELIQLCAVHRLLGPCADHAVTVESLPPETRALVRSIRWSSRVEGRLREHGYSHLLREFDGAGLDVVVLKGYVLATTCYEDLHHRPFNDLDILVAADDLETAALVLRTNGFEQRELDERTLELRSISEERQLGYRTELQHVAEFTKRDENTGFMYSVDVHFRLSTSFDHIEADVDAMLTNRVPFRSAHCWTFSPLDFVAHLGYHAWWDTQSVGNVRALRDLRLCQFVDVFAACRTWRLSCDDLLARSASIGLLETSNWALAMTSMLFGAIPGQTALDIPAAAATGRRMSDRWLSDRRQNRLSSGAPILGFESSTSTAVAR